MAVDTLVANEDRAARVWDRQALGDMLLLDPIGNDRFVARYNAPNAYGSLFGGQLIGQAAVAASATVDGQELHSIHVTFLRSGSVDKPLRLEVDRLRDGRRVSSRQVRVMQDDSLLTLVTCSHRTPLEAFDHQQPSMVAGNPELAATLDGLATLEDRDKTTLLIGGDDLPSIEVRIPGRTGYFEIKDEPRRYYWLRTPSLAGLDDPELHRHALAYLSDYLLSGVSLVPHVLPLPGNHIFVASLDHAIWFHRPVRCDDWLLFETDSPSASAGTGFSRATVYDRAGTLVASIAQEAMQLPR